MAIKNITDELETLRAKAMLEVRIDMLRPNAAAFILKALIVAGHVSPHVMELSLNLADTVREG
jgi:hypothetical protein